MATTHNHKPGQKHEHMGPLTCFAVSPDGVRFETQEEKEGVVLFLRQHPVVMLPAALVVFLMFVAPPFLFPLLGQALSQAPLAVPGGYQLVGTLFWYLATAGVAIASFLRWFFNIYIVTNARIVDIDFKHLLYKTFSEAKLDKIQDISYTSGGIIASFFNYGDVVIETAAEMPNLEFESVPHPNRVVQTISELTGKLKNNL